MKKRPCNLLPQSIVLWVFGEINPAESWGEQMEVKHMKSKMKIMAALLGMSLLAVPLMACNAGGTDQLNATSPVVTEKKTITTSGTGMVMVKPDLATIILGVTTRNEKAGVAAEENAAEMTKIIEAVKKAGLKDADIETSGYNISSTYDYNSSTPKFTGYQVTNTLSLKINDINKVAEFLDAAVAAGANEVQGVNFSVKDSKASYNKAMEAAVADAKSKAEVLAKAAEINGKLVVYSITESYSSYPVYYESSKMAATDGAGMPTPISPSTQTISATVTVTYTFN